MARMTRQIDPFVGKDYSNMGRSISSFQLVHRNAALNSKRHPRYRSSLASRSPALIKNEIETVTSFNPNNPSRSRSAAISTPSDTFEDFELSKQHGIAQRKRKRHRQRKLRLGQSTASNSQSTTSTVIPENPTNETQKIKYCEQELPQKRTVARKHVEGGEHEMDDWQQALAEAAKEKDELPCYHLILKKLEFDRMRGY